MCKNGLHHMFDQVLNKTGGDLAGNLQYLQIFFLYNLVTCFSTELYNNNISI